MASKKAKAAWCKAYRERGQRRKNKLARLRRHLLRNLRKRDRQIDRKYHSVCEIDRQAMEAYERHGGKESELMGALR